jgi:hypothetical protein
LLFIALRANPGVVAPGKHALRFGQALVSGKPVPLDGVIRGAATMSVETKVVLRMGAAPIGSQPKPPVGLGGILTDAFASAVAHAKVVLRARMALIGSKSVPLDSVRGIECNATTALEAEAQVALRISIALGSSKPVRLQGFLIGCAALQARIGG